MQRFMSYFIQDYVLLLMCSKINQHSQSHGEILQLQPNIQDWELEAGLTILASYNFLL